MNGRSSETLAFGPFRFVPDDGLWRDGKAVPLPPRALGILTALLATPGVVVSKQALMDAVWPGTFVTESSLLEAIGLVRNALGDDRRHPIYVQTVHRRGYRFIGEIASAPLAPEAPYALEPKAVLEVPEAPFFSGSQWRPIVAACVSYVMATIGVAIVFALLGQPRREAVVAEAELPGPRFAISHSGDVVFVPAMGAPIAPSWTPGGLEIAFAFSKAGPFSSLLPNGDAAVRLSNPGRLFPTSWSPDNTQLAFTENQPLTGSDIWVMDLRTRTKRPLAVTWFDETWARFSPDGRLIAYMSNESGRWEVYVQPADGQGRRIRVSDGGGSWPSWSSDSTTVFFNADEATMASTIRSAPRLIADAPAIVGHGGARATGRAELRVVLEWFAEMAAHVGPS